MKSTVILKLTPYQKGKLKKLSKEVETNFNHGTPGAILMQPWETAYFAGSKWNIIKCAYIPNEKAKRLIEILEKQ